MEAALAQLPVDWEYFLEHHWQQKPLFIPAALPEWSQPGFGAPVDADTLAGLALEADIESRLVERDGDRWRLLHGPFTAQDFDRATPWTLLVQAVDHYLPEVAALKTLFAALPTWRMDDVMVSYASDGGSVGPHYDNYDVFLLQGEGHRRWQLGQHCGPENALIDHEALRILAHFESAQEFLLGPGDMLYVPPGVAHWGVAQGECTTFSIGFRAPGMADLLSRRIDAQLEVCPPDLLYTDRGSSVATRAGEIRPEDIARVSDQVAAQISAFSGSSWFGELVTEPRYDVEFSDSDIADAREHLRRGADMVSIPPAGRVAWQILSSGQVCVFANGHSRAFEHTVLTTLETLCSGNVSTAPPVQADIADHECAELLEWLLECGCLDVD